LACGGAHDATSPADVVRAWSAALNRSDDAGAGTLFARNAEIVQGGMVATLRTAADAKEFNHSLPCSGRITKLDVRDDFVTATFALGERPGHTCDAPGATATAVFRVRDGKIVLWHQTAGAPASPPV
jgi:limonene-1,2-epoxide hydrolase